MFPVSIALIRTLIATERMFGTRSMLGLSPSTGMFAVGFVLFALVYIVIAFPARPYIFGHELTHVLFALATGARVWRFRIKEDSGSVRVSHGNMIVLLAPYFFPIYMVLLLIIFGLISAAIPMVDTVAGRIFSGLVGIAWGFHFCFTLNAMLQHQSDLEAYGFFFSFSLILVLNLFVLVFVFVTLSPVTCGEMWALGWGRMVDTLWWFWDAAWDLLPSNT